MTVAKKKSASPKAKEIYSEQIVFRVKPSFKKKLERYVERSPEVRGVGDAVRQILETTEWG